MAESITMWIISGISSINAILLAAIWSEIKDNNRKTEVLLLAHNSLDHRTTYCEKTLEKLPCVEDGFHCERNHK